MGPGDRYEVTVEWFNSVLSTLGDSFTSHNGMKFSTKYDAKHPNCKLSRFLLSGIETRIIGWAIAPRHTEEGGGIVVACPYQTMAALTFD